MTAPDESCRDFHDDMLAVSGRRARPDDCGNHELLGIAAHPQGDGGAVPKVIHSGWPMRMLRRDQFGAEPCSRSERHFYCSA